MLAGDRRAIRRRGKVWFHATDSTWRWRIGVGDVYFARYWVQTIRYLARGKLMSGAVRNSPPIAASISAANRSTCDSATATKRLAPVLEEVTLLVESPGEARRQIALRRSATRARTVRRFAHQFGHGRLRIARCHSASRRAPCRESVSRSYAHRRIGTHRHGPRGPHRRGRSDAGQFLHDSPTPGDSSTSCPAAAACRSKASPRWRFGIAGGCWRRFCRCSSVSGFCGSGRECCRVSQDTSCTPSLPKSLPLASPPRLAGTRGRGVFDAGRRAGGDVCAWTRRLLASVP